MSKVRISGSGKNSCFSAQVIGCASGSTYYTFLARKKEKRFFEEKRLTFLHIFQTLFVAWQNGALSNTYLQTTLEKFAIKMADIEQNTLAPPGWRVRWNRYAISISFTFYFPYDIFS